MPLKGQSCSQESIRKMLESKKEQIASQYNWIITEPYLDIVVQNGSANRKNKFITLREFKQNITSGISTKEMRVMGISKHVLQFFSNFCQGKIKITKDELIKSYETGKSLDEIASDYHITRDDLTYLRQLYDIKRKGANFIKRKKTEVPVTERQKEIIYGSLMGDGKRQHSQSFSSAGFVHGDPQKDYLLWKLYELSSLVSENSLSKTANFDKRYNKFYTSWRFYTLANSDVEKILKEFYEKNGKKEITKYILNQLTSLSVAVWFMDDGVADFCKKLYYENSTPEVRFCTDSFPKEQCELIVIWFKEKYDINCHTREHKKGQNRIIINSDSVQKLFDLISPHILPCMRYKIDYDAYLKKMNFPPKTQ